MLPIRLYKRSKQKRMRKAVLAVIGLFAFSACECQFRSKAATENKNAEKKLAKAAKDEEVKVTWISERKVEIKKKNVEVYGREVTVSVEVSSSLPPRKNHATLRLTDKGMIAAYLDMTDYYCDGKIDEINGYDDPVFSYRRGDTSTEEIFRKADALLARLWKELQVDEIVRAGPFLPVDPFVPPSDR